MTKLLERIQENYVFSQPGIQKKIQSLEDLIKRIDSKILIFMILFQKKKKFKFFKIPKITNTDNLYQHLKKNNIEFIQFAFRWMNNLLMREIPLSCTIRLWDTYHVKLSHLLRNKLKSLIHS